MILVDENLANEQRLFLGGYGFHVRQVGYEWGQKGFSDEQILAVLRTLRRVTFLTLDLDFYKRENCHPAYSIALAAVPRDYFHIFAKRFLRHPLFSTYARRQGKVFRIQDTGIVYWDRNASRETRLDWG